MPASTLRVARRPALAVERQDAPCATLMLTPAGLIAACVGAGLALFAASAGQLLGRPVAAFIPDLPLGANQPSENVRYANQHGDLVAWRPHAGRDPQGRPVALELLLARCGYRQDAALCLFLRPRPADRRRSAPGQRMTIVHGSA